MNYVTRLIIGVEGGVEGINVQKGKCLVSLSTQCIHMGQVICMICVKHKLHIIFAKLGVITYAKFTLRYANDV